jgi:hypothetical protein
MQGNQSASSSDDRSSRRSGNTSPDWSQYNRRFTDSNPATRSFGSTSTRPTERSTAELSTKERESNSAPREFFRQRGQIGNSSPSGNTVRIGKDDSGDAGESLRNQFRSNDSNSRLSNDKVREFLQLRRDGAGTSAADAGNDRFNSRFSRGGNFSNSGPGENKNMATFKLREQIENSTKKSDDAFVKRFGGTKGSFRDRSRSIDTDKTNDGNKTALGSTLRRADSHFGPNRTFDRGLVERKYGDWRKNVDAGDRGKANDHRDW